MDESHSHEKNLWLTEVTIQRKKVNLGSKIEAFCSLHCVMVFGLVWVWRFGFFQLKTLEFKNSKDQIKEVL